MNDRKQRDQDKEFRFSGFVMEKDHAEDAAEGAAAGGKAQKISFGDAESILFRLSFIGMEKGKRNEIHQYEEDKEKGIVLIDEFKNKLHTVCHFYTPLTLYREYTRMP